MKAIIVYWSIWFLVAVSFIVSVKIQEKRFTEERERARKELFIIM